MKHLVALLVLSMCFAVSFAQSPIYTKPNNSFGTISNRQSIDSTLFFPTACGVPTDSTWLFSNANGGQAQKMRKWAIYGDSCGGLVYVWNPHLLLWQVIGGGAAGVDTIYARTDSAFYKKQGTEHFAFLLSSGITIDTTSLSNRINANSIGIIDSSSVLKVALADSMANVRIAIVDSSAALRTTIAANFTTLNNAVNIRVINSANASFLGAGTWAGKPAAASGTGFWYAKDSLEIWYSDGSTWIRITDPPNKIFNVYLRRKGQPGDSTLVTASDSTLYIAAIRDSGSFVHVVNPDGSWTFFSSGTGGTIDTTSLSNRINAVQAQVTHIINNPVYIANDTTQSGADSIGHAPDTTHLQLKRIKVYNSDGSIVVTPHVTLQAVQYEVKTALPNIYVRNYGAIGDEQDFYDASTTSGSPNVTCSSCNFVPTDAGKYASCSGAGGAGSRLKSAIFAVTDAHHIVLANNASTTTAGQHLRYGTDNTTPIQNATNAACINGGHIVFDIGNYLTAGGLIHTDNVGGDPNSQIYLPITVQGLTGADSLPKEVIFEGTAGFYTTDGGLAVLNNGHSIMTKGTVIVSDLDSINSSNDTAAVIGSAFVNGAVVGFATLNSNWVSPVFKDITIKVRHNGTRGAVMGGINMGWTLNPQFENVTTVIDTSAAASIQPVNKVTGITGMYNNQGGLSYFNNTQSTGFYYGYKMGEHTVARNPIAYCNHTGIALMTNTAPISITTPETQWNIYNFATVADKCVGVGTVKAHISDWRMEDFRVGGKWFQNIADIDDPFNHLEANITFLKYQSGSGTPINILDLTSGSNDNIFATQLTTKNGPINMFATPETSYPGSHAINWNPHALYPRIGGLLYVTSGQDSHGDSAYAGFVGATLQHGTNNLIMSNGAMNLAATSDQRSWIHNVFTGSTVDDCYSTDSYLTSGVPITAHLESGLLSKFEVPIMSTGWNTAGRPGSPQASMFGWNSDSLAYEFYNGSAWKPFGGSGSAGSQGLNSVLGIGNTSSNTISLTSYGATAPTFNLAGTTHIQPLSYNNSFYLNNAHFTGSAFIYDTTGFASWIQFVNGGFLFREGPSGTAGANIGTIYEAMSLNNDFSGGIGGNGVANGSSGYWMNWGTGGKLNFSAYGSGSNTGTITHSLNVTSAGDVVESVPTGSAGIFKPTATAVTNVASVTADSSVYSISYTSSGRTLVHVKYSGNVTASVGGNATLFTVTLPFSTTNGVALAGQGGIVPASGNPNMIQGYAGMTTTSSTVNFSWQASNNSAYLYVFTIDYLIN